MYGKIYHKTLTREVIDMAKCRFMILMAAKGVIQQSCGKMWKFISSKR